MEEREFIACWLEDLQKRLRSEIEGLSASALAWRPDVAGNSIGVTVWHVARWLDIASARVLGDMPAEYEHWWRDGWAGRTGYDPRGIGKWGLGAITSYSADEVNRVPRLSADELVAYLDATTSDLGARLRASTEDAFDERTRFTRNGTRRDWVRSIIQEGFAHLGEIQALKALQRRAGLLPVQRPESAARRDAPHAKMTT